MEINPSSSKSLAVKYQNSQCCQNGLTKTENVSSECGHGCGKETESGNVFDTRAREISMCTRMCAFDVHERHELPVFISGNNSLYHPGHLPSPDSENLLFKCEEAAWFKQTGLEVRYKLLVSIFCLSRVCLLKNEEFHGRNIRSGRISEPWGYNERILSRSHIQPHQAPQDHFRGGNKFGDNYSVDVFQNMSSYNCKAYYLPLSTKTLLNAFPRLVFYSFLDWFLQYRSLVIQKRHINSIKVISVLIFFRDTGITVSFPKP